MPYAEDAEYIGSSAYFLCPNSLIKTRVLCAFGEGDGKNGLKSWTCPHTAVVPATPSEVVPESANFWRTLSI